MFSSNKPYTLDRITRLVIAVITAIVLIYLVLYVRAALVPFFVGWLGAYLINPIVLWVQRVLRVKAKIIAVILVVATLLALVSAFCWAFIPRILEEVQRVIILINKSSLPDFIKKIVAEMQFTSDIATKGLNMIRQIISTSLQALYAVLGFVATVIYLIFISKDFELISDGARNLIPMQYRDKAYMVIDDVKEGMNKYFRGQSLVALLVGILLAIGFSIISLPMGIILGLFIGVLNLVPYLQIIGIVPMIMVSSLQAEATGGSFWAIFAIALLVLGIVQAIQDLFLVPKIMGRVTGLNPAIIILSLSIWGVLLGIIGMIIALPLTTILLSYYKRFIVRDPNMIE